jgi:hypothetical protein
MKLNGSIDASAARATRSSNKMRRTRNAHIIRPGNRQLSRRHCHNQYENRPNLGLANDRFGQSRQRDEMKRAREITGAVYASIEIVHSVVIVLTFGAFNFSLIHYAGYLDIASWLAFVAFAAAAFWQFSYRWLRVIAAFLVFYLLPLAVALVYARLNYLLSTEWIFRSLATMLVVGYLIKLTIAGLIYLWSVRRERGCFVAASASPAT